MSDRRPAEVRPSPWRFGAGRAGGGRISLWPRSLRGQMIALVLIGLVIAQVLAFVILRYERESELLALRGSARIASV